MKLQATVNGQTRDLSVESDGAAAEAQWGAHRLTLDVHETEPGVYTVLNKGRSIMVTLGENGWAHAEGRVFQVEITDPRDGGAGQGAAGRGGQVRLTSPMPGKVIRVLVAAGEAVTAGQGLVVVEAMKMQNEMKAPRDAVVVAVQAQESATVSAGEVLLILE